MPQTRAPEPVDAAEFEAARARVDPGLGRVRDDVWRVGLPVREGFFTLCYLMLDGSGDVHLVDPGTDLPTTGPALEAALAAAGKDFSHVASVLVTHQHHDHLGFAGEVRARSGARVVLHEREQAELETRAPRATAAQLTAWGVPGDRVEEVLPRPGGRSPVGTARADATVRDGDLLDVPGRRIRVIATPGHTPGSMTMHDEGAHLVYLGDHVLPDQFPGIGLGGDSSANPIADYLGSIERVAALDGEEAAPGHGYRFQGLGSRCDAIRAHHLGRSDEVAAALDRLDAPTVYDVAGEVRWSAGFQNLRGYLLVSALRQTALHVDRLGRTGELRDGPRPGPQSAQDTAAT